MHQKSEEVPTSTTEVKRDVRLEDKMKLRELELSTQYQIRYLSDSFADLRAYVERKLDTETERFEKLNKKVTWLVFLMLAVLAGVEPQMIVSLLTKAAI